MEALAQEVGETIFLGVLCEESVLVVEKVEHNQVLRISPELGTTLPLRQTALGQVWLAFCTVPQRGALMAVVVGPVSVIPAERVLAGLRQELSAMAQQGFAVSLETWMPALCVWLCPYGTGGTNSSRPWLWPYRAAVCHSRNGMILLRTVPQRCSIPRCCQRCCALLRISRRPSREGRNHGCSRRFSQGRRHHAGVC
jgi:hypothetical protein